MAFKTFAPGVLTSSDVNTFLMRQAVITCTSSTRPASPSEGMFIYETDTDNLAKYDGSDWVYQGKYVNWTPVLGGTGWSFKDYTATGRYALVGDIVFLHGKITWGSTGTMTAGSDAVNTSVPVNSSGFGTSTFGFFRMFDTSLSRNWVGFTRFRSASTIDLGAFIQTDDTYNINLSGPTAAYLASGAKAPYDNGDIWDFSIVYEAA